MLWGLRMFLEFCSNCAGFLLLVHGYIPLAAPDQNTKLFDQTCWKIINLHSTNLGPHILGQSIPWVRKNPTLKGSAKFPFTVVALKLKPHELKRVRNQKFDQGPKTENFQTFWPFFCQRCRDIGPPFVPSVSGLAPGVANWQIQFPGISVDSIKDIHCRRVLSFLKSPRAANFLPKLVI